LKNSVKVVENVIFVKIGKAVTMGNGKKLGFKDQKE
jgi:hypothetical protein